MALCGENSHSLLVAEDMLNHLLDLGGVWVRGKRRTLTRQGCVACLAGVVVTRPTAPQLHARQDTLAADVAYVMG